MEISDMNSSYYFALAALFFWGVAPVFGKLGVNFLDPMAALTIRSVIVTSILIILIFVTGKWTTVAEAAPKDILFIAAEGICAAMLGQLAYYYALKYGEVGRVSPVVSAFPIIAVAIAAVFLGEKLTFFKIFGALMIVTGLMIMKL